MKAIFSLLLLLIVIPAYAEGERYERFQKLADIHRENVRREGFSYMVGGGLGLGLAVGLGIASKEALPKIGYSLIQVLGAAAITQGASLYFYGDGFTKEAARLKALAVQLEESRLSAGVKKKILNEATASSIREEIDRFKRFRKIRGYLELTTAVTSGVTIAFSKTKGSSSNAALGFIMLISSIGAIADLTASGNPDDFQELYAFDLQPGLDRVAVGMTIQF